jgi:hypothetical protein
MDPDFDGSCHAGTVHTDKLTTPGLGCPCRSSFRVRTAGQRNVHSSRLREDHLFVKPETVDASVKREEERKEEMNIYFEQDGTSL